MKKTASSQQNKVKKSVSRAHKAALGEPYMPVGNDKEETFISTPPSNKKSPVPIILTLILVGGLLWMGMTKRSLDSLVTMKNKTIPDAVQKVTGGSAKVKEIANLKEVSGVYEFELNLDSNGQVNKYTSYITKDGKILFVSGTKLTDLDKKANTTAQPETKKLSCADVKKADLPKVTAYVVANCPYGLQMQRAMKKAIEEQPELSEYLNVRYLGSIQNGKITSMHGDEEAVENHRQICIREEQPALYWPYVSCYMKKAGESASCLVSSGINATQLSSCMSDAKRGLAYAAKDFELADKFQIASSPTLLVNDEQIVSENDFGGRTPNALKELSCCGANTKGAYCTKNLTTDSAAVAFSETDVQTGGSQSAVNCNPQ